MRKPLVLLLAIPLLLTSILDAANVDVPDKNLAAQLRKALNLATDAQLTTEDLEKLTSFNYDARNKNVVTNLEGIQYAVNLTSLNLRRNDITDLSPISSLTKLKKMELDSNKNITDLTPLKDLPLLHRLNIGSTAVNDLSPVANIKTLKTLYIHSTQISDLSPLSELKDVLEVLSISSLTQVTTLEPLQNMSKLRSLNMSNLPDLDLTPLSQVTSLKSITATKATFSDLSPLGTLTEITFLNFDSSSMTSLDGLETLSKVTHIKLYRGSLVDVSALAGMTALRTLEMEGNDVVDISALADLKELVTVDLDKNQIIDISPLGNKEKLKTLSARENNIQSIDSLVNLPVLQTIDLQRNEIQKVDNLANLPSLKTLNLNYNQTSSITSLKNLSALVSLYLSVNNITDLSAVANIPTLVNLYAAQNQIPELPSLANLDQLKVLDLNKNQVSDLSPVSACQSLVSLFADENGVTTLGNWQNLTELNRLYLRKNQITDFSTIGHCAKLKEAYINDNPATILGDWSKLTILWRLHLFNCQLNDLSGLSNCVKLKEIHAFNNEISTIGDWSPLTALQTLKLERNRIRDITVLNDCTALRTLQLTYNDIDTVGDFSKLTNLQTLHLHYNQLSDASGIGGAINLKTLYLSFNRIEEIQFLESLSQLNILVLNNNLIQGSITLPDSLAKVTDIFLYHNQISEILNTEALQGIKARGHDLRLQYNFLNVTEGSALHEFFAEVRSRNESSNPTIVSSPQFDPSIDYDSDGIPSDWEVAHKTNALRANSQQDPDGDLYTNLEEYQNDTDPTDPESFPTFAPSAIQLSANTVPENAKGLTIGKLYAHDLDSAGGFEVIQGELSWLDAQKAAEESGGHLATINSKYEERLLYTTTPESLRGKQYWIGATNSTTHGEWTHWITGEPMLYYPWGQGEPNGGTSEPYLELYLKHGLPYTVSPYNTPQYFPGVSSKLDLVPGALEALAFQTYDVSNLNLDQNQGIYTTVPTGIPVHYSDSLSIRSRYFYRTIIDNFNSIDRYTAVFRGYFYADKAGTYEFGNTSILGKIAFWIDLDQDGIFEHEGAKGYESMVKNWGTGNTSVNLEVGYYPVCIVHTIDAGNAIILPTYKVPGGEHITIHPEEQSNHWFARPIEEFGSHPYALHWNDEYEPSRQGYVLEKSPSFELIPLRGAKHNNSFEIINSQLRITAPQDFETTPELTIGIRVTDRHDLTYEQLVTVSLEDVNEPSAGVGLSTTQTPEDRPAGSLVAFIFTEDPDKNDTFTYELIEGEGAADNAAFTIVGNQLLTTIVLDRETQETYTLRIRSTDAAGHQAETSFIIEALDMPENQPPTDIQISTTRIKENLAQGTVVATLTPVDADSEVFRGGIGTYTLVPLNYANYLKAATHAKRYGGHPAVFTSQVEWDMAVKQIGKDNLIGKNIVLGATDAELEGTWKWVTEEPFTFNRWAIGKDEPNNREEIEHDLIIWEGTGEDLLWGDAFLGKESSTIANHYLLEQPVTYEFVAGKGDTHNSFYSILGNKLIAEKPADFETNSRHSIRIKVTDVGGLSYEKVIHLDIQDAPDAPQGITISKSEIAENLPPRTEIGLLSIIDQDANERPSFKIISDSPEFVIVRDSLQTLSPLNFEEQSSFTLKIEATDKDRRSITQEIVITITDANDLPTTLTLSTYEVPENAPANTEVATLSATDPDEVDSHRFIVIGGRDQSYFRARGDILSTTKPIDFEATPVLEIIIQVTDLKKGALDVPVILQVKDNNDAPTSLSLSSLEFSENLSQGSLVAELSTTDQDPTFHLISDSLNWDGARQHAETLAGDLATIASVKEWVKLLDDTGGTFALLDQNLWLGASDAEEEDHWLWIDNTEVSYARWANPKYIDGLDTYPPDNLNENEHYLAISSATGKRLDWDDMNGDLELDGYILETPHTFTLVAGKGDIDNDHFQIVGNQLQMVTPADFETRSRYSIRLQVTDPQGLSYEQSFQLNVSDAPDKPTSISLSNDQIPENQPGGFEVATLSAEDADAGERFTYTLSKSGENDNDLFYVLRDKLHTNQPFNFESRTDYTIRVQVMDKDRRVFSQDLDLTIINANDPPSGISIDNPGIDENQPRATLIGTLSVEDPDPEERHVFTIAGGKDQSKVYFKRDALFSNESFDFETQPFLDLIIKVTDKFKASEEFPLTLQVNDINDAPTDILLDNDIVAENQSAGTKVGLLSLVDIDQIRFTPVDEGPQIFPSTFELVSGEGDTHNALFAILEGQLNTSSPLNFEERETYSIRIKGTDHGGLSVEKTFTITTTDQPDAPSMVRLDNDEISESTQGNTLIGTFQIDDEDVREFHTIAFKDHPEDEENDNEFFNILQGRSSTTLMTLPKTTFDYEEKNHYTLYVEVTDKDGLQLEQSIELKVTNFNEAPSDLQLSNASVVENLPAGTEIGSFSTLDPDLEVTPDQQVSLEKDSHTYLLTTGEGDTDNKKFRLDRNTGTLTTAKVFDYETELTQTIRVQTTDAAGLSFQKVFSITILNGNDAPTAISTSPSPIIITEGEPAGTVLATLSATDVDTGDSALNESLTFALTSGEGDTHNRNFEITGDQVLIKTPLVHKKIPEATFRVTATDKAGASVSESFTVTVLDRNDPPTSITIDNTKVQENVPFGTLVGNLTATDPDIGNTHTFSLVNGDGDSGNSSFFIQNGNQVVTNALLDFEKQRRYSIRVEAEDNSGATYSTSFSISVSDERNEIPRYQLAVNRIPEAGGLTVGAGLYEENMGANLSATPAQGYTFAGWTGDLPQGADSGDSLLSIHMDSDKTINAYFARTFHAVEVSAFPDRHGYAKGGGNILFGSEITLTAEELSGDDNVPFSHWRINGEDFKDSTEKTLTLTVEDDLEVEAVFDIGLPENFVLIPAGTYVRDYRGKNEHTAAVSAFYTSTHETSKAEWYQVYRWALKKGYKFEFDPLAGNGRNMAHNDAAYDENFPISGVSWDDMVKWCNARSEMEGWTPLYYTDDEQTSIYRDLRIVGQENSLTDAQVKWRDRGFRLPTELEWERAARGGIDYLDYPNGNSIDDTQAFYNQRTKTLSLDYTTQSDRLPNGFGLYDMAGNAWEACWDWYSKYWYQNPLAQEMDTKGPNLEQTGLGRNYKTARGGSSYSDHNLTRIGSRVVFRTWYNYAITLRPVFPAPTEPDATIRLVSSQSHLGTLRGSGVYKMGSTATLEATPGAGAIFKEWQDAEGNVLGTETTLSLTAEENMTIRGIFEDTSGNPPLYTLLTFAHPKENGTVSGKGAYLADSTIQITATPNEGLDFAGWSGDAFGTSTTLSVTIHKNMEVTGAFGDTSIDTDRDGLSDLYEKVLNSNPYESDSDGDRIRDGEEVNTYSSDPTKTDTDGDGHDDRSESIYGTSLIDPNDFPFIPLNQLLRHFIFKGKPYDYSGNKGHGTATDIELVSDRWGLAKNAYEFNGSSTFVEATGYHGATGSSARALAAWFRLSSGSSGPLVTYGSSPNAFNIQVNDSGILEVVVDSVTLTGTTALSESSWHHFLVTLPENGTIADIAVYIDGQLQTTTANGDTGTQVATSSNAAVLIGKNSDDMYFAGDIDDVRIWERELAASEAGKLHDMEVYKEPDTIQPTITQSPASQTVALGDSVELSVMATAKPTPTYTWQKLMERTWVTIKGANTETLILSNISLEDALNYRVIVENSEGIAYSRNARITVLNPPSITEAPRNIAFLINRGGRLYAHVSGSGPLTYEWFRNQQSLGNSKGNFWFIPKSANQEEHGGNYSFKVTNSVGEVTSEDFTVSVIEAVTITQDPISQGINSGESGSLTVVAEGGGTLTYQWKKYDSSTRKYVAIEGATEATYSIAKMTPSDEGLYQCVVANGASTLYSRKATLTMYQPTSLETQPRTTSVEEYDPVHLSALATGDPQPSYIWQKFNAETDEWEDQLKFRKPDLILRKTPRSFAGTYRVKAMNEGGVAISNEIKLVVHYKPVVTRDPLSLTANEDTDVTLSVAAHALDRKGTDITYKWFHNKMEVSDGEGIAGAKTDSLHLTGVNRQDAGVWYCLLSNSVGVTQSRAMKLIVNEKPYATTTLSDIHLIPGKPLSLSVGIGGYKPLTMQWYKDEQPIHGATTNKFYLRSTSPLDAGIYKFEAENIAGKLTLSTNVTFTGSSTDSEPRILAGLDTETPDHDADGDGLPNLLEQALGSDPANPDSTYSPTLDIVEDGTGQQYLAYHFTQNNSATDLTTHIEVSTDLQNWEPLDLNEATLTNLDRGPLTETTIYLPATNGQRFLRLRVEK